MSHTPGPWKVVPKTHAGVGIASMADGIFNAPRAAAAICGRHRGDGGEGWHYIAMINDHTQAEDDARLIAALPDLLQALREIADGCIPVRMGNLDDYARHLTKPQIEQIARAAIAKAEGKA